MTTAATGSANTGPAVADPSKGEGFEPADTQKPPKEAFLAVAYSRSLREHGEKAAYGGKATTLGRAKWIALNECVKARGRHSAYKDDCEGIAWVRDGCLILAIENLKVHKWGPPPPDYEPKYGWAKDREYGKAKGRALYCCHAPKHMLTGDCNIAFISSTEGAALSEPFVG